MPDWLDASAVVAEGVSVCRRAPMGECSLEGYAKGDWYAYVVLNTGRIIVFGGLPLEENTPARGVSDLFRACPRQWADWMGPVIFDRFFSTKDERRLT